MKLLVVGNHAVAYGAMASTGKEAVDELRSMKNKIGLVGLKQ